MNGLTGRLGLGSARRVGVGLATRAFVVALAGTFLVCGIEVVISLVSLRGNGRVTLITLFDQRSKSFLEMLLKKFALTVPAGLTGDLPQLQLMDEPSVARGEEQNVFLDRRCQMQQDHELRETRRGDVTQSGELAVGRDRARSNQCVQFMRQCQDPSDSRGGVPLGLELVRSKGSGTPEHAGTGP